MDDVLPVVVIGGGPVGLAAGAELAARGLPFVLLERGPAVADAMRQWGHVRLFSPWRWTLAPAAERLLAAAGWNAPDPDTLPTGGDIVGMKSYGRAPTFLMATGYEQVRSVVVALAGDHAAAAPPPATTAAVACCGASA